mgnify:CR=1 FL=1
MAPKLLYITILDMHNSKHNSVESTSCSWSLKTLSNPWVSIYMICKGSTNNLLTIY